MVRGDAMAGVGRRVRATVALLALACAGCASAPQRGVQSPLPPMPAASALSAPRTITPKASVAVSPAAAAQPTPTTDRTAFVAALLRAQPQLDRAHIEALLDAARVQPQILAIMARPAEARPWRDYRPIFLNPARIAAGVAFYREHRALVDAIAARYGVEPTVLVAILGVETSWGRNTGSFRVLDALYTLAFHYPPRAAFFRKELAAFLSLPRSALPAPRSELRGSYAGAMGWCQFMPSSFAAYAVSASGSGPADIWNSLPDVLASTANYLARHGWQGGAPIALPAQVADDAQMPPLERSRPIHDLAGLAARGFRVKGDLPPATPATVLALDGAQGREYWITFGNFQVITRYNTSAQYALAVTELAAAIAQGADADR